MKKLNFKELLKEKTNIVANGINAFSIKHEKIISKGKRFIGKSSVYITQSKETFKTGCRHLSNEIRLLRKSPDRRRRELRKILVFTLVIVIVYFLAFIVDNSGDIHALVRADDIGRVHYLLSKNPNMVEERDTYGETPLHLASNSGYLSMVRLLVSKGARVNAVDENGKTPLHYAVRYGHKEVAKLLLLCGAEVNARDKDNMTPIKIAMRFCKYDLLNVLIEHKAFCDIFDLAAIGDIDKLKMMIAKDPSLINLRDKNEMTLLHYAVSGEGQREVAEYLISRKADINARNNEGETPLHIASSYGNTELAKYLIKNNADVNVENERGWTALHIAASYDRKDLAEMLINKGADINAKTKSGKTPLHLAASYDCSETLPLLIARGAQAEIKDKSGKTAFKYAKKNVLELMQGLGVKK